MYLGFQPSAQGTRDGSPRPFCLVYALPGALQMEKTLRGHFWADFRVTVSVVISRGQWTGPSAFLPDWGFGGISWFQRGKTWPPDFKLETSLGIGVEGHPPQHPPHSSPSPGPRPRTPFHSAVGMISNIGWCWESAP